MDYYVYAYLRSKESTNGSVGTPYYIGKGRGRRMYEKHQCGVPLSRQNIILLAENLSHTASIDKEIDFIAQYGRIDKGTGILRNLTDGGEGGGYGRVVTEQQKLRSSKANRGQKRSKQTCQNISEALLKADISGENNSFFNKKHTAATKKLMSDKKKGKTWEEIFGVAGARKKREVNARQKGTVRGPFELVKCPHCEKTGGKPVMKRWHFDNCKFKSSAD